MNTREIALLTVAVAASTSALGAQDTRAHERTVASGLHLVIAKNVTDELGALADSLEVETVRCLIGVTRGESAVVDLVWKPRRESWGPGEVQVLRCPLATVALWRNHPVPLHQRPEEACRLSDADIRAPIRPRSPPIHIVQVTSHVACWWTKTQIELRGDVAVLESLPGQRRGDPADTPRAVCKGSPILRRACA